MIKYLIIFLLLFSHISFGQTQPSGSPTNFNTNWLRWGDVQSDSIFILPDRDTGTYSPRFPNNLTGRRIGGDSSVWYYTGQRWKKLLSQGDVASTLANNGLSKNGDTVQFGQTVNAVGNPAALNTNREIPFNGFNIVFTGTGGLAIGTTTVGNRKLNISATSTTQGINIGTVDGTGINVVASGTGNALFAQTGGTGTAVTGSSTGTSGYGVLANSSSDNAIPFKANNFSTLTSSATPVVAEFVRNVFGIPADGAGLSVMFRGQTTTTTDVEMGQIRNYFSTALNGSRSSAFGFHLVNNAVSGRKALLASTGQWTWDGYPALTAQIDTTTYKPIAIDGSGNVVKMVGWAESSPAFTTNNIGTGFAWAATPSGNIKRVANSNSVTWDSTTTANSLTAKIDTVFSTYIAYVDTLGNNTTGVVNNPAKPFATINGALDATALLASCVIQIGVGTFNSPDSAKVRSNIWFRGSGMPATDQVMTVNAFYNNSISIPTKLIGGTILRGTFAIPWNDQNIHVTNFGIDVGSNWVTNFNGGVEVDGFLCAQLFNAAGGLPSADGKHQLQINTKPRQGMLFKNIRVLLSTATSPFHAFLVENTTNPIADNIYTTYGFAGVIIKTIGGIYTNLHTQGHGTYHIILKSNDYSHCYGVVVDGFECGPIIGNNGVGVTLDQGDAGSPGIYWCNVSNGFINHCGAGLSLTGDNMNISNINIVDMGTSGVVSSNLLKSNVSNITQRISPQQGFNIDPGTVLADGGTTWSNCTAFGNIGDGFRVLNGTAKNYFENIFSAENTGYGFNTNGSAWIGNHSYYSNTAGATNGTVHNRLEITGLVTAGTGISISGIGTEASPYSISTSGSSISTLNTLTAATQTFATGTSGTDFNIVSSGSTHTFNIPSASTSNRGLVTTISQTFGGTKTFNEGVVVTSTSAQPRVYISGNFTSSVAPGISGIGISTADFTYTSTAAAGTESSGQNFNTIGVPTLTSANAISYTGDVSTVRFVGAPIAAGSTTISRAYNIFANDNSYFEGIAGGLNETASNITLGDGLIQHYTGTGGTWTLPTLANAPGRIYMIKNMGSGNLTVQRGGSDNLFDASSVTSVVLAVGDARMFIGGGSFWAIH